MTMKGVWKKDKRTKSHGIKENEEAVKKKREVG